MNKIRIGNWVSIILIILTVLFFIITVPGAANFWYKQGAGHSIGDQMRLGVDEAVAKPKAFAIWHGYSISNLKKHI